MMMQDACVKDVFRELDGFLVLISTLSTTQIKATPADSDHENDVLEDTLETTRLIFVNLAEAMHNHIENTDYFTVRELLSFLVNVPLMRCVDISWI
jgi:hypothetical protein